MGKLGTATCSAAEAEAQHKYVQVEEQDHRAVEDDDAGEQSMAVDERWALVVSELAGSIVALGKVVVTAGAVASLSKLTGRAHR